MSSTAGRSDKAAGAPQIVDILEPGAGDIVVEGKRGLCGFATTNLDFIWRNPGNLDASRWVVS